MKRFGTSLGILTAVVLASTPVLAHEDCDDVDQTKTAMAERGDGVGAQSLGACQCHDQTLSIPAGANTGESQGRRSRG